MSNVPDIDGEIVRFMGHAFAHIEAMRVDPAYVGYQPDLPATGARSFGHQPVEKFTAVAFGTSGCSGYQVFDLQVPATCQPFRHAIARDRLDAVVVQKSQPEAVCRRETLHDGQEF